MGGVWFLSNSIILFKFSHVFARCNLGFLLCLGNLSMYGYKQRSFDFNVIIKEFLYSLIITLNLFILKISEVIHVKCYVNGALKDLCFLLFYFFVLKISYRGVLF